MSRVETEHWMSEIPLCESALEGRDIVVLSHQRWDSHFTPMHGTTLRLAQRNRVLLIEPPDSVAGLRHHRGARVALARTFNRLERFGPSFGLYHVPPLFLPFQPYSRSIQRSIEWTYCRMVRDAIRRMELRDPLFWIFQFNTVGIVAALEPRVTVYECVEEVAGFARRRRVQEYIRGMDAELCRRADVVFVPNAQMHAARQPICRALHTVFWPVDFDHYHQALNPGLPIPQDLREIAPPIIGFYGILDPCRLDVPLVVALARRRPDWNIVIIGGSWPGFDASPLQRLPNVHFLGAKPLKQLPAYVKGFDVAMIPYTLNEYTTSIMPLKLMEYLATGKPVVSTPLPAVLPFAGAVRIAANEGEFESQCAAALANPGEGQAERLDVARTSNWDHYMKCKTTIVADLLESTRARAAAGAHH